MSKSIVTFQLGNYANFVGSHFWNLHEFDFEDVKDAPSYLDHDVNYFEGITPTTNQVTFTPRLISWDWKQNVGPRIIDDIYEEMDVTEYEIPQTRRDIKSFDGSSFSGNVQVYSGFTEKELNLNKTTDIPICSDFKEWNQFAYSRYHPKSFHLLPKLYRSYDSTNFQLFTQGIALTKTKEMEEQLIEQTRYFTEKCDYLQGFQIFSDCHNGFSGVSMVVIDHLVDEYRKEIISFPVFPDFDHDFQIDQKFNFTHQFVSMNTNSVFWAPISLWNWLHRSFRTPSKDSRLIYNSKSHYHSSAILSLAIKSIMLPCLSRKKSYSLRDFDSLVAGRDNKMANLALSLPFPIVQQQGLSLLKTLDSRSPSKLYSLLNPFLNEINIDIDFLIGTLYGVSEAKNVNTLEHKMNNLYKSCNGIDEIMELYFSSNLSSYKTRSFHLENAIPLRYPFPKIFDKCVDNFDGHINQVSADMNNYQRGSATSLTTCPQKIPLSSILYTSNDSNESFKIIFDDVRDAIFKGRFSTMLKETEKDELLENIEQFLNML